jgi:uncharacterized damage-inducible protein DinB
MGLAEHARLLMAYNAWANLRVIECALMLDDAALGRDRGASKGSILGNLQHIVSAQDVWLRRWQRKPWRQFEPPPREQIAAAFEASHGALSAFVAEMGDADWHRIIDYNDTAGEPQRVALGALITHVVNHGTLHRGEAGMLLAAHDRSPGDLDFVYFVMQQHLSG